jgi:hypothetical protein
MLCFILIEIINHHYNKILDVTINHFLTGEVYDRSTGIESLA